QKESKNTVVTSRAKLSVALFLTSAIVIVLLGLIPALRPMVETLRATAAQMTMHELQDTRENFVQGVQNTVAEDLSKNGLELESV
ncbi:SPFH domain-containing protein, partial [Salmonella enterica subsp. enterica serovar Montevideo]|nr:SPFH domain-containing protein [Salmonella enterica subsp. enterica serovar Montevideo]